MEMAASPPARKSLRGAKIAQTRSSAPRRKKNHMWVKDPNALTRTRPMALANTDSPPVPGGESVRIQRRKKKIDSAATNPRSVLHRLFRCGRLAGQLIRETRARCEGERVSENKNRPVTKTTTIVPR